ncbi:MAG TPA: DNA mismatch repair protein MutS [Candidatus Onthenecus intestinigallinarum]|uniref:DNA mismatch repair protein MutS n=1 Tax=Candidatus Onthenecus intestinigallinarum TaxID=2840875 RepID=A0A9D0ZAJ4_9FIRM|nr:DNA mismatch repair protein MutS [Candidatus Onthenecus intestinigallinarum]
MANVTPMMQQYLDIKERYPGMILFFRLGDFYEMFFDDAITVSRELELTLTGKDCGLQERAPMCGVPYHAAETYINRLIGLGHKVAICEQLEDPALCKGLVKRDVIRIVTPGTVVEQSMLSERRNSYILALCADGKRAGVAFADVSTGEFFTYESDASRLADELARIAPREIIADEGAMALADSLGAQVPVSPYAQGAFRLSSAKEALLHHFHVASLDVFGLRDLKMAARAAGALMRYLGDTQKNALEHIATLRLYRREQYMALDRTARRNLELTESLRGERKGSLLALLDKTATSMGGRTLRAWIEQPLCVRDDIERRLDAVAELKDDPMMAQSLFEELRGVYDVERLLSRVSYRSINARDCLALGASLSRIPQVRALIEESSSAMLRELLEQLDPVEDVRDLLLCAINPDAPLLISEGNIIREGYNEELDRLRRASKEGVQWVAELEAKEREETGIKNLRIRYNKVFGYYIEVTKSNYAQVPYRYTRKQTLANSERYVTPELHELEEQILGAQERALRLEQQLFAAIRDRLSEHIGRLQATAQALKTLDALLSLALAAVEYGYARPEITDDGAIDIEDGRHPVVEQNMEGGQFVPNDTHMDADANRMLIITGPNMAGKSTYMRQVALITLMAHMGSFVPARAARIALTDRIFTRVGASDDLASGQSTFMVEMSELAHILMNATARSLIVLDEIGRGTSTFDGLSIAWAVVEYMADKKILGAKTLFATHYHELSELEGHMPGVVNFRIAVKEHGEDVIFLRKIVPGGADKSFGIHVARLAGIPRPVLLRAHEILARLETRDKNQLSIGQNIIGEKPQEGPAQMTLFDSGAMDIVEELKAIDVMALTPIEAMNLIFKLREEARRIQ